MVPWHNYHHISQVVLSPLPALQFNYEDNKTVCRSFLTRWATGPHRIHCLNTLLEQESVWLGLSGWFLLAGHSARDVERGEHADRSAEVRGEGSVGGCRAGGGGGGGVFGDGAPRDAWKPRWRTAWGEESRKDEPQLCNISLETIPPPLMDITPADNIYINSTLWLENKQRGTW